MSAFDSLAFDSAAFDTGTAVAPPVLFGGGYNADKEWFEREEAERREAERVEAARLAKEKAETERKAERPPSDALLTLAPRKPAPLVRRGPSPRVALALLTERIKAWAEDRERAAAAEAERQALAFAIEQQRLAEEAAARQLALDEDAAQALLALLMNE